MSEEAEVPPVGSKISVWVPILYLSVLVVALVAFSKRHRQRTLRKLASTKQFYETNSAKDAYEELKVQKNPPKKLLVSALLAWGVEDFTRMVKFKENGPIMADLLQNGVIGEDFYERFTRSSTLNEREFQSLAKEFESLDYPFATAFPVINEITMQNAMHKRLGQMDMFKQEYNDFLGSNKPKDFDIEAIMRAAKAS